MDRMRLDDAMRRMLKFVGSLIKSIWERLPNALRNAAVFMATVAVVAVTISTWYDRPADRRNLLGVAAMVGLVGIYPMAYVAYLGVSATAQRDRLQDDFRLLGLVKEEELASTVQKLYQTVYSPIPFVIYISLLVIVSLLIVYGYLHRAAHAFLLAPETTTLIFYSYLGAYVFSVQELVRRYNTFDLQPQVYSSMLARMIVAVVIVFVGAGVIQFSGGQLVSPDSGAASEPQAWAAILAFVIGVFPESGLRWFTQQANRVLTSANAGATLPLRNILGISAWHEARLAQMGIDDAQNLATADLRRLLLTTQFDTQQIVQWIDQAILYVKVGGKLDRYRDAKITSLHELRLQLDKLSLDPRLNLPAAEVDARKNARDRLATVLGAAHADELERAGDYSDFPNYAYIAEYYLRTALVARQRASVGMDVLVGALEETNFEKAVETAQQLLRRNRQDPELYNRLGYAYYQLSLQNSGQKKQELLNEAYQAYSEAIRLNNQFARAYYNRSMIYLGQAKFEQAVIDCTNAINIDNRIALAFNNRGLAYMKMGYVDRAIEDLDEALRLDDRLGVAYLNRGVARNAFSQFQAAAADFERAYLLNERPAELWISWGIAHIGLEQYEDAVDRLSQAVLFEQDAARAYAKRGYAYMQRDRQYYPQAQSDLETAVGKNDSLMDAHVNLGLLFAQTKRFDKAIEHYQTVLKANQPEFEIVTRYNLAIAFIQLGRQDNAKQEFEAIMAKAPVESIEAQKAKEYLASLAQPPASASSGGAGNG